MITFIKTLYGKISLIFLVILLILGILQVYFSITFSSEFIKETDQKLNRFLAQDLAKKFEPFLKDSIHYKKIEHSFHDMMVMNPRVEFYLLNHNGDLLAYFAKPEKIKRMKVDTQPILEFLHSDAQSQLPILGDDPRNLIRRKPFSVTPIEIGNKHKGYLYVILGGELYDSAISMVKNSYILRTGASAIILIFLITAVIGLLLFFILTKRLSTVTRAVKEFEKGNYDQKIEFKSEDEIGQLANAFNHMAATITDNMVEIRNNDRLRRELIANISHDLRSPLASIQGYLETIIMKEKKLTAVQRNRYLETVYKNIKRLNKLVYELFELSKLDAKQVKPATEPFSITELVQDIVLKFNPLAQKNNIKINTHIPSKISMVKGDIGMIERALSNLIENALNYTPENSHVTVELKNIGDKVTVIVKDNGKGIDQKDLPYVFDRFYRSDKSRLSIGTGLGLAITKKIIEAHNCEITVESKPNKGTAFAFQLNQIPD